MKAPFSPYLERLAPGMKKLIGSMWKELPEKKKKK